MTKIFEELKNLSENEKNVEKDPFSYSKEILELLKNLPPFKNFSQFPIRLLAGRNENFDCGWAVHPKPGTFFAFDLKNVSFAIFVDCAKIEEIQKIPFDPLKATQILHLLLELENFQMPEIFQSLNSNLKENGGIFSKRVRWQCFTAEKQTKTEDELVFAYESEPPQLPVVMATNSIRSRVLIAWPT